MNFLTSINLNKNELQNATIQNLTSSPASPKEGQIYYHSTEHVYYGWDGTVWRSMTSAGAVSEFTTTLKAKLDAIAENATKVENSSNGNIKINAVDTVVYTHPVGDANLHVPATSTTNNTKVLKAGSGAGSATWSVVNYSEISGIPVAVTVSVDGLMDSNDKVKLNGIATNANNYTHPTGDGNYHVPITGITNNGNILAAGSSAGSLAWVAPYSHPANHPASIITQDASNRFTTDAEKTLWNVKEPPISKLSAFNKNYEATATNIKMDGTQAVGTSDTIARGDHTHPTDTSRETAIGSKLSAFNKNYETSASNIKMNGTAAIGSLDTIAKGDHVHPTDTSRAPLSVVTGSINGLMISADKIKLDTITLGVGSGNVPVLDTNGKLELSTIPQIAISDTFVIATQVAMLALSAEIGDIAIRTDINKSYILKVAGPTVLANWQELLTPTDSVTSVAGRTGVVTLSKTDVGLDQVANVNTTTTANITDSSNKRMLTDAQEAKVDATSGTNTGDETAGSIKSTLGVTTLSGSNTGDQDLSGLALKVTTINAHPLSDNVTISKSDVGLGNVANIDTTTTSNIAASTNKNFVTDAKQIVLTNTSNTNTGDETLATIKTKLLITTLSGSNTGDQDLSVLVPKAYTVNGHTLSGNISVTQGDVGLGVVENKTSSTIRGEITNANVVASLGYTPVKKYAVTIGDAAATTITVTHSLNTMDITMLVREIAIPYNQVITDMQLVDANNIKLLFAIAPTAGQYRVVVTG